MSRHLRSRWLRLLVVGAVLAAWAVFLGQQLPQLRPYLGQLRPAALLAAVGWGAVYFGALALCWAIVLRRMGGTGLSLSGAARIWLHSMLSRYVPGNVWHIVGRVLLAADHGVPGALVVGSATVEQLLMLLAALALAALSLPFWPVITAEQLWLLGLLPLGLACLHPAVVNRVLALAGRLAKRSDLVFQHRLRDIALYLALYTAAMLMAGLALVALLLPLAPVTLAAVPFLIGAAALAWALGFLSFLTPSGLGVREAALAGLLVQLYPLPVALAASLLFRLALTLGEMVAVAVAYGLSRYGAKWMPSR